MMPASFSNVSFMCFREAGPAPCRSSVDFARVLQDRVDAAPFALLEAAVVAALAAGVASDATKLLDPVAQAVAVTVEQDAVQHLHMARVLALAPQLAARARPVHGAILTDAGFQRLAVDPG